MEYGQLKCFLLEKMRMSHIYQPVMIKHLLRNNGVASDTDIAKEISLQDPTQIEYYQNITNQSELVFRQSDVLRLKDVGAFEAQIII